MRNNYLISASEKGGIIDRYTQVVTKDWGTEHIITNTELYCVKVMNVLPGWTCSTHYHELKRETFTLVSGCLTVKLVDIRTGEHHEVDLTCPGDSVTIDIKTPHAFCSIRGATFIESSTESFDTDNYRFSKSRRVI